MKTGQELLDLQYIHVKVKPFVHPEVAPMEEIEPFNVGINFHHNQPVTQGIGC